MIIIPVLEGEVEEAKRLTAELDSYKTYDKFKCSTNYIGVLGELVFDRYLTSKGIEHTWVEFIKKDIDPKLYFSFPDFRIGNLTIDLKTTYSDSLWFQKPKFDIYIYANVTPDNKFLLVSGFMTNEGLLRAVSDGTAKQVSRGSRTDYVLSQKDLLPIILLSGLFSPILQEGN